MAIIHYSAEQINNLLDKVKNGGISDSELQELKDQLTSMLANADEDFDTFKEVGDAIKALQSSGVVGPEGPAGKSAYELAVENGFEGTVSEWLESLKGADGQDGQDGKDGQDGQPGTPGQDGKDGKDGVDGQPGTPGQNGQDGKDGVDGQNGKSAYELAVENGFEGTVSEWLESLKGADGKDGKDGVDGQPGTPGQNGQDGKDGVDGQDGQPGTPGQDGQDGKDGVDGQNGKSAYELAVENGFEGTVSEWLESLKGETGTFDPSDLEEYATLSYVAENYQSKDDYATKSYVDAKISEVIAGAPEALDTLKEISDKLGDNDDAVAALTSTIAGKADLGLSYTKAESDAKYLTEHQSLENYVTSEDLSECGYITTDALSGLATEEYVNNLFNTNTEGDEHNHNELLALIEAITARLDADDSSDSSTFDDIYDKLAQLQEYVDLDQVDDAEVEAYVNELKEYDFDDLVNKVDVLTAIDHSQYVAKSEYDELNAKYNTLFNYVYSQATGDAATPLNADYVANTLNNTTTSVTVTEGELGDVTIPETTKAMTVTAPMQDDSTITLSSPKAFTLINTSENPVDVTIDAPAGTSIPTMSCSGDFDTLEVNNGSIGSKTGEAPLTATNVVINNDLGKNATVSGVEFNDNATITSDNVPGLGVGNNNTDQNAPNATINAENSTVTLNKGQWNTLNTNVSDTTLIVTQNANIDTLNVVKGNVTIYDREITNRINTVVNNNNYTVACRETNVTTGNELNSALTGNPGIVNVMNDITRGRITWGIFGSGNYLLDLKGHTVTLSDANFGLKTRNTVNIKIVDTGDGNGNYGKLINDKSYGPWADEDGVITIDVPETTEIIGVTHTLYAYGSRKPHINVISGTYKMTIGDDETDIYDANGNYKFMLNHYDSTFTREGNCFTITGGTFYGFDPSRMNGDPGNEYSMIDLNEYEVQTIGTFVDSKEHTMNIYKVVKK